MWDFRKLAVWEKSHELTLAIYQLSATFPREEVFGLTSQMRRTAVSIPANIAEGCGREGDAELARFLRISTGSASELDQLQLTRDLSYIPQEVPSRALNGLSVVKRMQVRLVNQPKPPPELAASG